MPSILKQDEQFMRLAIEQAGIAQENGDVVIGGNNQGVWRNRFEHLLFNAPCR
jgi:hypothetical protein